jgi:beta-N-acetylhexosaminidase
MALSGMPAVGKHFPGHSGVIEDPHDELPRDDRSLDDLRDDDIRVYRDLKPETIQGVMSCHVCFPRIDALPASLSYRFLTGELRDRLAFQGPIFSDDLMMGALGSIAKPDGLAKVALEAGADMVLLCNSDNATDRVLDSDGLPVQSEASRRRLEAMRPDPAYTADDALLSEARERMSRHI